VAGGKIPGAHGAAGVGANHRVHGMRMPDIGRQSVTAIDRVETVEQQAGLAPVAMPDDRGDVEIHEPAKCARGNRRKIGPADAADHVGEGFSVWHVLHPSALDATIPRQGDIDS